MSDGEGDNEDDNAVLDRLIGMKDEWLQLEGEIRDKAASLQSELNQQRKVNEDLTQQLAEARKAKEVTSENEELVAQLKRKDEEIEKLKKENASLLKKLEGYSSLSSKSTEETASDNMLLIDENDRLRTRLEEASSKIFSLNGQLEQLKNTINNNKLGDSINSVNKKLIEELQEEVRSLREELLMEKEKGSKSDTKVEGNAQDVDVKELQDMLLEKTNEVARNVEQIEQLKNELAILEEEYGVLKAQNSALNEELNLRNEGNPHILELTDELKRAKGEMHDFVDEIHKLKTENKELSDRQAPPLGTEERQLLEVQLENTVQVLMMKNKMLEDAIKEKDQASGRRSTGQSPIQDQIDNIGSKKREEEANRMHDEVLKRKDEELMKLQDKLAASFESEKNLLAQVQQLQHQAVSQLLHEQNLKQQLVEAREAARARQALEQALSQGGDETNAQKEKKEGVREITRGEAKKSATSPPIQNEAQVLSLQNKIYHLSLSLDEANARIAEAHDKKRVAQAHEVDELNAVLRDRELRIVEMEREMVKYKEMEGEMWKYKALGTVVDELKEKQPEVDGEERKEGEKGEDEGEGEGGEGEEADAEGVAHKRVRGEERERRRGSDAKIDEAARRRVLELEAEGKNLRRNIEELTDELQKTEESDRLEISHLKKKIADLTKQQANAEGGKEKIKREELLSKRRFSIHGGEERTVREREEEKRKNKGDMIDRAVHEAALEMLRAIQREHTLEAERVGREFGEEKFRHQETMRKLQEALHTIAALRKKLKSLTGTEYCEEIDENDEAENEVSEMQRLRESISVAVAQVEEERKSLAREREAHALTHALLREERIRALKDKETLEEQIAVSRKNLAEIVEEVLEAEALATERERQLVVATTRIKDLESRIQETSPKSDSFRKSGPQVSFSFSPHQIPPYSRAHSPPASKTSVVSGHPPPTVSHHLSQNELVTSSQPSTQIPQMRTARTPGDTYTFSQNMGPSSTPFSSESNRSLSASYASLSQVPPLSLSPAHAPPPPPLTLSQISSSSHPSSHFAPPRSLSQPFSSQPISSQQHSTRHLLPPRPSSTSPSSSFSFPFSSSSSSSSSVTIRRHSSPQPPASSTPKSATGTKSETVAKTETGAKTESETPKEELVALLSRTSRVIASKSTEMENIRKQLQATEQRLRDLQRDKEEMDAHRTVLRDGIDAFGRSIGQG